jgi:hypothetical protein
MTEKNQNNRTPRAAELEKLLNLQKRMDARVAAAKLDIQRHEARAVQREQSLIGEAVMKAVTVYPDFRTIIAQTALGFISDEKQLRFLSDRGWKV